MILTEDDVAIYCPEITLSGDELLGAIRQVEFAVQSPEGAGRSLEIKTYTEIKTLRRAYQNILLSYFPILETEDTPITVWIKGNIHTEFDRQTNSLEWVQIDPEFYLLDAATNQLSFNLNLSVSRRTQKERAIQVKVEYTAGWDFTDTENDEVNTIKAITAKCLSYQQSVLSTGIRMQQVQNEYMLQYGNNDLSSFGLPKSYLHAFKKYAPRRGVS